MKTQNKFNKYPKIKTGTIIIIFLITILITIAISSSVTYVLVKNNNKNEEIKEEGKKLSPYTLDEIYKIIEDKDKYEELNKTAKTDFNYTLFHFYDYFGKETPFKVVSKLKRDKETGEVTELLEFDYINYYEFMSYNDEPYKWEQQDLEHDGTVDYRHYIDLLIYGYKTEEIYE